MVTDQGQMFDALTVPNLSKNILHGSLACLGLGSSTRLYYFIKVQCYWKGLKIAILNFMRHCQWCQSKNVQASNYVLLNLEIPKMPMDFIAMDLIGPFEVISKGNKYASTVIYMLTNCVFCIPLTDKTKNAVVDTYLKVLCCQFGRSHKALSDN